MGTEPDTRRRLAAMAGISVVMMLIALDQTVVGTAFASVTDIFPHTPERIRWQVMLSAAFGISSALGPVLGGWMTEHLGWRSVFYVNLPIGLLAWLAVWKFLPRIQPAPLQGRVMDWPGVVLLVLSVSLLLITTELGESLGFASPLFWGLLIAGVASGWAFFRHQYRTDAPIIPPRLLDDPTVRLLGALSVICGLILFVLVFYAPLLLQGGFELPPKQAGFLITPVLVMITVGSVVNGRLQTRLKHPEKVFSWGALLFALAVGLLCLVGPQTAMLWIFLIFALCGLSLGFQLPNLSLHMQACVGHQDQGAASALVQTLRTLGSMFGASLAGLMVHLGFNRAVAESLATSGIQDHRVLEMFVNPQILLRPEEQSALRLLAGELGFDPQVLLQQASHGLVRGIQEAFAMSIAVALAGFWLSRKLPPFNNFKKG